jgi:multidrug transporter EmrE-like cation transporter
MIWRPATRDRTGAVAEGLTCLSLHWIALLGAIVISMAAQTLLKAGAAAEDFWDQLFSLPTIVGLMLYGGSAMLYIIALRRLPMSVALPCTAISYVVVAAIGYYMFGESLGVTKVAAIGLICAGVALLALG